MEFLDILRDLAPGRAEPGADDRGPDNGVTEIVPSVYVMQCRLLRASGHVTRKDRVLAKASSQKFIARNRAPRVQIEYDVETYGSEKKVQLPFVVGVMSDLSGKPAEPLPPVADRKMLEIDVDNFDDRMKSMKPRVAFMVPNTLTGEGNVAVDITFESMDDFSPGAVAKKVDSLAKLLEARTQLSNLLTYMDGKSGAEDADHQGAAGPGAAADAGRRARRRHAADRRRRNKPCPQRQLSPSRRPAPSTEPASSDFAVAAEPRVQAEERQGARGGRERGADAGAAGAGQHRAGLATTRSARSRR